MTEQVTTKKKTLKVLKKLPRVQVGTILNIFWSNGSYEKPSNLITKQEIDKNFIEVAVKIDWSAEDTGTVTLKGKFNYLIYKGGDYFFLTPIRPIDIKKQEFVYSVVRDISMTMLQNPKYSITGTLTRTLDKGVLSKYLDFTKAVVEDYDEMVTVPLSQTLDVVEGVRENYRTINLHNFTKAKVFSTSKLAWFLGHLTQDDVNEHFARYLKEGGPAKLFFNCEYDELLPQKYVLNLINNWLKKGNLVLGSAQENEYKGYTPILTTLLQDFKKTYVLTNADNLDDENKQPLNLIKVNKVEGKVITEDYFEDINEIVPLDITTGKQYYLNNRHIFDMLEDEKYVENISQFSSYYLLLPRAYTDIKEFITHNIAVVSEPLLYTISTEELEKKKYLLDSKQTEKEDNTSLINNIKVCYFPDYWYNKSWSRDSLRRMQESILKTSPVVGFMLYDIYDYWRHTRYTDPDLRYSNMFIGKHPYNKKENSNDLEDLKILSRVEIVTGIRLYEEGDSESSIPLIANYEKKPSPEEVSKIVKASGKVNFGLVASQQCKLLYDVVAMFTMYTFLHATDLLQSINTEFAKQFTGSFITVLEEEDGKVTDLVTSREVFDLTKGEVNRRESIVEGVNNMELMEHCYTNYDKIRDLSTIRTTFNLPEGLVKGDLFWSNAAWCFYNTLNHKKFRIDKTNVCVLLAPNSDLGEGYSVRFSLITPVNTGINLTSENNAISSESDYQRDTKHELYPWLYYEKQMNLIPVFEDYQSDKKQALKTKKDSIKKAVKEFYTWAEDNLYFAGTSGRDPYFFGKQWFLSRFYDGNDFNYFSQLIDWINQFIDETDDKAVYEVGFEFTGEDKKEDREKKKKDWYSRWTKRKIGLKKSFENSGYIIVSMRQVGVRWFGTWWFSIAGANIDSHYNFYNELVAKINKFTQAVKDAELAYWVATNQTQELSKTDIADNFKKLFTPPITFKDAFKNIVKAHSGYKVEFSNTEKYSGCLPFTLSNIYQDTASILLNRAADGGYYWTDIKEEDIKKETSGNTNKWIFKLVTNSSTKGSIVKAFVLIKWNKDKNVPVIQAILTDTRKIKRAKDNVITPSNSVVVNPNIYQCINQKNFLYAHGQKIPIKGKLFRPNVEQPFEITTENVSTTDTAFEKYRLRVVTPVEIIDTKITVAAQKIGVGQATENYIELERLKLEISERQETKSLDIASGEEKARVMREKSQNAKDELAFNRVMAPFNIVGGAVMGAARVARFTSPIPDPTDKNADYRLRTQLGNVSGGLLGLSTAFQMATGFAQYGQDLYTGYRDLSQADAANSFAIEHEQNTLDSRHKHEELREKLKILDVNSNFSEWSGGDVDEIKDYNKILFGDKEIKFGFVHYRPKLDGVLMRYLIDYYSRYGVEIFVNDYTIWFQDFFYKDLAIWQFDSISNINISNYDLKEKIKRIFMNGTRFTKVEYQFEKAKLSLDESYVIQQQFDNIRQAKEQAIQLLVKGEIDSEYKEVVKLTQESLDKANNAYNVLKEEEQKLNDKVKELEAQIAAGGCSKEVTDQLEKYKDSASLLSEQKMALEEEKTALTNQLALEKRKMEAANQQIINAGAKNLDLVRKLAAANAAKSQAEASKALAEETREQAIKERDASNALYSTTAEELRALRVEKDRLEKEERGDVETLNRYKAAIDELSKKKTRLAEARLNYRNSWGGIISTMENRWENEGSYNWVRMCGKDWYISSYEFLFQRKNIALYSRSDSENPVCGPWFKTLDGTEDVLPVLTSDIKIDVNKVYKAGSYEGISFYVSNSSWHLDFYLNSNLNKVGALVFEGEVSQLRAHGSNVVRYSKRILRTVKEIATFIRQNKNLYPNPVDAENYALMWEKVSY